MGQVPSLNLCIHYILMMMPCHENAFHITGPLWGESTDNCETILASCQILSYGPLTQWGRVSHICVSKIYTIISSDNGLSPGRHQAIIWTNVGILFTAPLGANFSEILIDIYTFSFKKMHLKMSSGKWRPFCLGLNVITYIGELGWFLCCKPE